MFAEAKSFTFGLSHGESSVLHDRSSGVTKDRRAGFLQSGFTSGRCVAHKHARTHNVTSR